MKVHPDPAHPSCTLSSDIPFTARTKGLKKGTGGLDLPSPNRSLSLDLGAAKLTWNGFMLHPQASDPAWRVSLFNGSPFACLTPLRSIICLYSFLERLTQRSSRPHCVPCEASMYELTLVSRHGGQRRLDAEPHPPLGEPRSLSAGYPRLERIGIFEAWMA